jgi:hypothetical protein
MTGYDDPLRSIEADLLGRTAFAGSITRLVVEAPPHFGPRIGIYGRWGEGKSSILNMVAEQLSGEGHHAIRFNPWGCTTREDMVRVLADVLLTAAQRESQKSISSTSTGAPSGEANNLLHEESLPGRSPTTILETFAGHRSNDIFSSINTLCSNKRVAVLIDDVDRIDPKLLPSLFFALHEVLTFPGVSFIIALDPTVVGAALVEHHSGFESGLDFLAKIVQFPRWLPQPSRQSLRDLAERERSTFAPFLVPDILAQKAHLLPSNPRQLRALIRGLWCLSHEVPRHDADEIDQSLLLVLEAIRQESSSFLIALTDRKDLLDLRLVSSKKSTQRETLEKKIGVLANTALTAKSHSGKLERLISLALELCNGPLTWTQELVRYHAYIIDRPHALTWREFRSFCELVPEDRVAWVVNQALARRTTTIDVLREATTTCIRNYGKFLLSAAHEPSAAGNENTIRQAGKNLLLLEWIWFDSTERDQIRTPEAFKELLAVFSTWVDFGANSADSQQRQREREVAVRMAHAADPAIDYIEVLAPWMFHFAESDKADSLAREALCVLEEMASNHLLDAFRRPEGISGSIYGSRTADKYILLSSHQMWSTDRIGLLKEMVEEKGDSAISENCCLFLSIITDPRRHHLQWNTDLPKSNKKLLSVLWSGAISVAVQYRFFARLERIRNNLDTLGCVTPLPFWWNQLLTWSKSHPTDGGQDDVDNSSSDSKDSSSEDLE